MFDIGFAELLLIAVVGLLVIGPERLPGAIRTTSLWINRIRRSFNEVRAEVERELHNDAVMRELRENATALQEQVATVRDPLASIERTLDTSTLPPSGTSAASLQAPEDSAPERAAHESGVQHEEVSARTVDGPRHD